MMEIKATIPLQASAAAHNLVVPPPLDGQQYSVVPAARVKPAVTDDSSLGQIIWLDPQPMVVHSARKSLPQRTVTQFKLLVDSMRDRDIDITRPVLVLPDHITILFGDDIRDSAVQNGLTTIPCCIVDPKDPMAFILQQMVMNGQLTADQHAHLAWQWRNTISSERTHRRARRAAAARYRTLTDDPDDLLDDPRFFDTRQEASKRFGVSQYALRKLDEIAQDCPKALEDIRNGEKTISAVVKQMKATTEKKIIQQRRKDAAALPQIPEWQRGDPTQVLKAAPEHAAKLIVMDLMEPVLMDGLLTEHFIKMMADQHSLYVATTWKDEPEIRRILQNKRYIVSDRYIWNPRGPAAEGTDLISILLATYGGCQSGERSGRAYLTHSTEPGANKLTIPKSLFIELIERATLEGELVIVPVARTDVALQAARSIGRKILAIAADEESYLSVQSKLTNETVGGAR